MNRAAEDRLMRYLDGEADAAEVTDVLRSLSRSARERALARDLRRTGDVLRDVADTRGKGADDIATRVMARIEVREKEPTSGTRRRWLGVVPVAGLALAAAAAVVVLVRPPLPPTNVSRVSSVAPVLANLPDQAIPVVMPNVRGAAIETVDLGTENGTIFLLPGDLDVTPVLWMTDGEPSRRTGTNP